MIIYIDDNYKCHTENDGSMRSFDLEKFNGKCSEYIEGYRYVPRGDTWIHKGVTYKGEMLTPWREHIMLEKIQKQYEEQQEIYNILGL